MIMKSKSATRNGSRKLSNFQMKSGLIYERAVRVTHTYEFYRTKEGIA
ncbi:hypothetical protein FHS15_000652 [Paenibacillus castaneae]|nr:hypothetical protein [Paenibacillus castaneae]NIK75552.1 hypothetical protein [Paenibacillus castaneae]